MIEIPPNETALYAALTLVALWFVLKRLVFSPFLEALERREQRTTGALDEAKRLREEAGTLRGEYEQAMAEVRREATRAREEIRRQAESEEREILETARAEATRTLEGIRSQTARELEAARTELESQVDALSDAIAGRLLERRG